MKKLILALALVLCFAESAFGQASPVFQVQNSGTLVGTQGGIFRLNLVSGCTATQSGGSFNITCTGGAGNPGGTANQIQFNNAGTSFAGISSWTTNGSTTITGDVNSIFDVSAASLTNIKFPSGSQNLFFATPNGSSGVPSFRAIVGADVPTLNQSTTGNAATATSAAKWTTARNLAGNSVDGSANATFANKFIVQGTTDAGLSAAQFLGALATGIVKNTTTTGILSIAVAGDFPTLNQNTSGTAANLSGTPALPNGTTASTQTVGDNTLKLATDAFVIANAGVGTITGVTTGANSGLTGGASSGSPSITLRTDCTTNFVLQWSGTSWACSGAGTGTVTNVIGTAGQTSIATGTSTPVVSLTSPLDTPGDVVLPASNSLNWGTGTVFLAADANAGTIDLGSVAGGTDAIANAGSFVGTGTNAGATILKPGNGSCPTPTAFQAIVCNNGGTGNVSVSQNGGGYTGLAALGSIPFDSTNLSAPTGAGTFTYPAAVGLTLGGTAPASSSSNGTNAGSLFVLNTPTGGATTGSATSGGNGGGATYNFGNGGSGSGGTNAQGGNGGGSHVLTGNGGPSSGSSTNSSGGNAEFTMGLAGTGGGGSAGAQGKVIVDQTVTNAIVSSPQVVFRGNYEATSGPTYGNDDWSVNNVLQASTVNGNTTLTIAHTSGSSGTAAVSVPNLIVTTPTGHGVALFEGSSAMVSVTAAADTVMMGNSAGTGADPGFIALPTGGTNGCSGSSDVMHYNTSTHTWSCGTISGSGTVNTGTATHLGYYATSTTAISDAGADLVFNGTHTYSGASTLIFDLSAISPTAGLKLPSAAGAAPTADGFDAFNTTIHAHVWGSNGTTMVGAAAATGTTAATTCSNQFVSAVSSIAAPTCTTITLAGAQFANQGTTTTVLHGNAAGNPSWTSVGTSDIASSITLTTPNIGAATGTSLLATGIVDGTAPITITTGTTGNLGTTYSSGYTFNQEATAGTGVTYTLPATAVGKQYCVQSSGTTGVVNTGVLTVYPPASSFVILNGVVNTVGGGGTHGVASGGAAGDGACFVAIDATHWEIFPLKGTWTLN